MSTLTVSNISDATTTVGTSYVVNGSAKAWGFFNGLGTPAFYDSLNMSSITDHAVGQYDLNVTNAFSSANHSDIGTTANGFMVTHNSTGPALGSASSLNCGSITSSGTYFDSTYCSALGQGDLA